MVDLGQVALVVNLGASVAVVVTVILVVLQLRQNSRLLEQASQEYRANVAFGILEKLTDESFPRRRKAMHDAARLLSERGPADFDDTSADLEARNFAFIYQIIGTLVRAGVIEEELVLRALGRLVVADWEHFQPISDRTRERYGFRISSWEDFRWLADRAKGYVAAREAAAVAG
ncbi:MAG TPA: hypothetical protein VGV89_05680 [Thermoplasmata archaeon]|nr:hypothetical protein [Thermoplasmata archaeon]